MKPVKDSIEEEFMALFQELRDWIADDPIGLERSRQMMKLSSGFSGASNSR
jgi:hypothetical protein